MYELSDFSMKDMFRCGDQLCHMGDGARSMEEAAQRITSFMHSNFIGRDGVPQCALVRFFKTHTYDALPPDLRTHVDEIVGEEKRRLKPNTRCLTLLGTSGDLQEWNQRKASAAHKAIPLISTSLVKEAPMIAQLIQQLGFDLSTVIKPDPEFLLNIGQHALSVFYVPKAEGSPYVPVQKGFVMRYGIQSVLGFGGMFPSGEFFAVVLFTKVAVPLSTAQLFSTLALGVRTAITPFIHARTFAE
ncbi:MAG TPA: hypothetical protein VM056_04960 [Terriglobales bacterium]|nr:hypothetical protein [Terriglobales bacterium]